MNPDSSADEPRGKYTDEELIFTQLLPSEDDDGEVKRSFTEEAVLRDGDVITEANVPKFHHVKLKETDYDKPHCRICTRSRTGAGKFRLVSPCACKGSSQFVHKKCLRKWCTTKNTKQCEVCNTPYQPKFLKAPGMPKSDADSMVLALMLRLLLVAVFALAVYLLLAHLFAVDFVFTGDCWLLLFLVVASLGGIATFHVWFVKNSRRIRKSRRREQLRDAYQLTPLTGDAPVENV